MIFTNHFHSRNGKLNDDCINVNEFWFKEFKPSNKTILSIEDDGGTDNIHTAKFSSFPEHKPGKINIKWDTGSIEEIDLSRVCMEVSKRRSRRTNHLGFNEDFTMKTSHEDVEPASKPKRRINKPTKAAKKVNVEVQSSSSDNFSVGSETKGNLSEISSRKRSKPNTQVTSDEQSSTSVSKNRTAVRRKPIIQDEEVVLRGFSQSTPESLSKTGLGEYLGNLIASLSMHEPDSEGMCFLYFHFKSNMVNTTYRFVISTLQNIGKFCLICRCCCKRNFIKLMTNLPW
jgi:hypothetical protein